MSSTTKLMLLSIIYLGFLIFDPSGNEAHEYFPSFGTAVWTMLMVLNGSNWPSPIMPAFYFNHAYCLYFFVYIIIFGWGFLNLILGEFLMNSIILYHLIIL